MARKMRIRKDLYLDSGSFPTLVCKTRLQYNTSKILQAIIALIYVMEISVDEKLLEELEPEVKALFEEVYDKK